MAYNYEYPYTDPNRYNDDWLLSKMKELDQDLSSLEERVLKASIEASKEYIDSQLAATIADVERVKAELVQLTNQLEQKYNAFETEVRAQLTIYSSRLTELQSELDAAIIGINARTDLAIEQNNEYIFDVISEALSTELKVVDYFTGTQITVQEMFDKLAALHVTDGITYSEIPERDRTVSEVIALGATYTDLVLHGGSLIV